MSSFQVSQLLRETTEQGKGALASSLDEQNWLSVRNKVAEAVESASSIHSLLQQVGTSFWVKRKVVD